MSSDSTPATGSSPAQQGEVQLSALIEIPVLNVDQVKAGSPEAVSELQKEGKAAADANLAALEAAFPNQAAWVLECQKKGLDVNQAKALKFDQTQAELAVANAKVAELEAKAANNQSTAPVVTFAAGDVDVNGKPAPQANGSKLSHDEALQAAAKVWQKYPHLATEFDNINDFVAYHKRNPNEDFSKRK